MRADKIRSMCNLRWKTGKQCDGCQFFWINSSRDLWGCYKEEIVLKDNKPIRRKK